jgi:hypothetical protein
MKKLATFLLLCAFLFTGCGGPGKKKKKQDAAETKPQQSLANQGTDQDFNAFLGRLRKAVATRDMNTMAQMMTPDFAFVMGATSDQDRKGEGVFQYWDEHGLWPELEGIMTENFVKKDDFMVAPPQFANAAVEYDGYRAGIRRVNGSWKFAYFVNG